MVGLDLNPPWTEGIRNTVFLISKMMIEKGHEIHFLTKGSNDQQISEKYDGFNYHRIPVGYPDSPMSGVYNFLAKLPTNIYKIIKKENIDIVHGHSVFPFFGDIIGLSTKAAGAKSVFTVYSSYIDNKIVTGFPTSLNACLKIAKGDFLAKQMGNCVDRIIVTSEYTYNNLVDIGVNKKKLKHINIGIDVDLFNPKNTSLSDANRMKNELGIPLGKKVVLFAGDLVPWKGLDIFIKAMSIVNKMRSDVVGLVAEKSMFEFRQKRLSEIGSMINNTSNNFLYFTGRSSTIWRLYEISDIIAYPYLSFFSLMDTPLMLLEGMAMAKPIIATNLRQFQDIITHNYTGILIDADNDEQLAASIVYILENELDSMQLGMNSFELINKKYTASKMANDLNEIYFQVCDVR